MTRPEPTGVRFVLSDCAQAGRESELDAWYDTYAVDCTRPGLLVNAVRYRALDPQARPRFAAVYETVTEELEQLWPETQAHPSRHFHERSPLLDVVLKSTYRRIEPILPVRNAPLPRGVGLVLCDCSDLERRSGFDEWVHCHMRSMLEEGVVTRASRYEIVEGEPVPPRYLEIYESAAPERLVLDTTMHSSLATVRYAGVYLRTFVHPATL